MTNHLTWSLLALALTWFPAAAEDAVPSPEKKVARAQFTTAIDDREPVDKVVVLTPPAYEVYFFTDLRHLEGETVVHRWAHRGEVMSQVPFKVEGPRWRVFSRKVLKPDELGEWSVTVLDENGWPLYMELFRYQAASDVAPTALPSE
jgi:Protein of unknown function (DUF2914)